MRPAGNMQRSRDGVSAPIASWRSINNQNQSKLPNVVGRARGGDSGSREGCRAHVAQHRTLSRCGSGREGTRRVFTISGSPV
jgi:hypothetical protein